jgi:hypothetical protein
LCEEKDFENVSVPHLSVQNKTARVQQKKESKLTVFFFYYLISCFAVPVF